MKSLSILACSLLFSVSAFAQFAVSGHIVDKITNEPIIGAAVMEAGTNNGVISDIDGNFTLRVNQSPAQIEISFLGYKSAKEFVILRANNTDIGVIRLASDSKTLEDVTVVSTIAVSRKTPVALSSITPQIIEEKLGTAEFPEILKSTPGVHSNPVGAGFGDSEILMRGFESANVAVMINGAPMNDMENGSVYWSNWAGLADVTRSMQTQRGLGASKVSAPSVGGTINIVTNGLEAKRRGSVSYQMGNNNMNKYLISLSTGMNQQGWAISFLFAKSWGDGNAQGLDFQGYNYFFNLSKRINDKHQLSFTGFAAPQEHYQRSDMLTIENWKYVEEVYGVRDYKYNPTYGYDDNGVRMSARFNKYHKPQISLNHQWQISDKSSLSTSAYVSIGRGFGYSGQGNGLPDANGKTYNYQSLNGANYGELNNTFRRADGTFDYGAVKEMNANAPNGSCLVLTTSLNHHNWYGLLSTFTTKFLDSIDFYVGIDARYYEGLHTNEIIDLLGGDYYIDNYRQDQDVNYNSNAANNDWVYKKLKVGDVVYRDYTSHVMQEGLFFQAEYNKNALSAFLSGSFSYKTYWRYDRLYYDKEHAESDKETYPGFTIKAGANYNLNEHHNVFANVGMLSVQPKFAYGAFMSSTTSNAINPDAQNEKIISAEVGYGFHTRYLNANLNAYYTIWRDKAMTKSGTMADQTTEYYMNMTGVDAQHMGVELDVKAPLTSWVELTGMLSIGDWQWNSNAKGYAYDQGGRPLQQSGEQASGVGAEDHAWAIVNLKGVRVGGSAQTTAALGANFNIDHFRVGADWTLYARNYSYYSFSGSNLSLGQELNIADPWEIPSTSTLDANASYRFKIGDKVNATFSGNVNNLLNNHYITKAQNSPTASVVSDETIYCYFHVGRTWSFRLKLNF